jgi:hypothetical protein
MRGGEGFDIDLLALRRGASLSGKAVGRGGGRGVRASSIEGFNT